MQLRKIYLAGAINGLTLSSASEWRNEVTFYAKQHNFTVLDPLRGEEFVELDASTPIDDSQFRNVSSEEIVRKDLEDINQCDLMVVNLEHLSSLRMVGTKIEMGYAYAQNKPIFSLNLPLSYQRHPFLKEMILQNFNSTPELISHLAENKVLPQH